MRNSKRVIFTDRSVLSVALLLKDIKKFPLLTADDEYDLCQRMQKGSRSAREQLIRHARALSGLRPAPPPFADWRAVSDTPRQSVADLPRRVGIREEGDMV